MDRGAWWQKHWTGLSNQTTTTSVQTRLDLESNEKGGGELDYKMLCSQLLSHFLVNPEDPLNI